MIKLLISPAAKEDMQEIGDYISRELKNRNAALRLIRRFRESFQSLKDFPEADQLEE